MAIAVATSSLPSIASPSRSVESFTLAQGTPVYLMEDKAVPVVGIYLIFRGGAMLDVAGKEGTAAMLVDLLLEGSGDDDALAYNRKLERDAIRFSCSIGKDQITCSINVLKEALPQAIALAVQAFTQPRFEEAAIQRVRQQMLSSLAHMQQTPRRLARQLWWEQAFAGHAYAVPNEGTPASLASITKADLQQQLQQVIGHNNASIGIAGDINRMEATAALETLLGSLPKVSLPADKPVAIQQQGKTITVPQALRQSIATFGHAGIARSSADYYAALILNHIIGGGGFSSRLMEEVREKRGLTYGISTGLMDLQATPVWQGSVATDSKQIGESLRVVRMVLEDIQQNGVTDTEVAEAKAYLNGSFPLRLDSSRAIAWVLASAVYHDLSPAYLDEREALIEGVSVADVNRLAREWLKPDQLTTVVLGQEPAETQP